MIIKILATQKNSIANSISKFIFSEAKESEGKNVIWLNEFVQFYQSLKTPLTDKNKEIVEGEEYFKVDVKGVVKNELADIIGKYIFLEIKSTEETNPMWMIEMMSIYNQLLGVSKSDEAKDDTSKELANIDEDSDKSASSEVGENYNIEKTYSSAPRKKTKKEEVAEETESSFDKMLMNDAMGLSDDDFKEEAERKKVLEKKEEEKKALEKKKEEEKRKVAEKRVEENKIEERKAAAKKEIKEDIEEDYELDEDEEEAEFV